MYRLEDYANITNTLEMVTPDKAKEYLFFNRDNNRNKKLSNINGLAEDIRNGNWTIDNNSICFDTNGELIDGQNRLYAIIKAGIPVPTFVRRGLIPKSMQTIDSGTSRTLHDRMKISGAATSTAVGTTNMQSVIRAVYLLLENKYHVKMTVSLLTDTYNRFHNVFDLVYSICCCKPSSQSFAVKNKFTSLAIIAAMCNGVSERRCRAFVDCITKGDTEDADVLGCNSFAAHKYATDYARLIAGRGTSAEKLAIANRAIYCFAEGKKKTTIAMPYEINETGLTWLESRLEKRKEDFNA